MPSIENATSSTFHFAATSALVVAIGLTGCGPSDSATPVPAPDAVLTKLAPGILLAEEDFVGWTLAERMERAEAPAVAVTFVDRDGPLWTRAAGVLRSSDERGGPASVAGPDTRFLAKSLAKPVTAFATLRLVEQGVLDLDAPLDRYLERWSVPDNEFTEDARPTLRQLLAGRYEYSDGSATTIALTPDGLTAAWGEMDPVRLFPEDSLSYFNRAGEGFTFGVEDDVVTALTWSGDFGAFEAKRVE